MKTNGLLSSTTYPPHAGTSGVLCGRSTQAVWQTLYELVRHHVELEEKNEELRHSQSQLEVSPAGFIFISRKGRILEADAAAEALLGEDKMVLVKMPISRFIPAKDRKRYNANSRRLFGSRESQAWDQEMVRMDGGHFLAHMEITVVSTDGLEPRGMIVLRDITPRQRVEDILRKS